MRTSLLSALVILSLVAASPGAAASPSTGPTAPGDEPETPGAAAAAQADAVRYTYTIERRGDVDSDMRIFATGVSGTLNDPAGWRRANVTFRRVASGADLRIILASPSAVAAAAPVCSAQWSCRVGNQVLINVERWEEDTEAWQATLEEYRDYVVNHEVGHWLGLGHRSCPGPGQEAYVMQQQSITLGGCDEHGWPRYSEITAVADRNGTAPVPPGQLRTGVVGDPLWYLRDGFRAGGTTLVDYGTDRDVPVMGDWNGDGVDTPGLFYEGIWSLDVDADGRAEIRLEYGRRGDVPVVGDWNGDGVDEIGVYRGAGDWHLRNSLSSSGAYTLHRVRYGRSTDVPVTGDWNGDGVDGIGAYRDGEWWLRDDPSPAGTTTGRPLYGFEGDVPVTGDWDGDGQDGIGIYRDGEWHARSALSRLGPTIARTGYGASDDVPVVGDTNGNGYDEIGVVRGRL